MTRTALHRNTLRRLMARNLTRHRVPWTRADWIIAGALLWPAWVGVQAAMLAWRS